MTIKHQEVANAWSNGEVEAEGSRMFIDNGVIYSYGYHFPIAFRLEDGTVLFNKDGYSRSTARHKNIVKRCLGIFDEIILLTTQELKQAIDNKIKSKDELMMVKL